jgi:hypothetical protein
MMKKGNGLGHVSLSTGQADQQSRQQVERQDMTARFVEVRLMNTSTE